MAAAPGKKKAVFDINALEREGKAAEPFTIDLGDDVVTLEDPQELDWQDVMLAQQAALEGDYLPFLRDVMTQDDLKAFLAVQVPNWKLEQLMQAYYEHYGVTVDPEALAALRRSSRGTARR